MLFHQYSFPLLLKKNKNRWFKKSVHIDFWLSLARHTCASIFKKSSAMAAPIFFLKQKKRTGNQNNFACKQFGLLWVYFYTNPLQDFPIIVGFSSHHCDPFKDFHCFYLILLYVFRVISVRESVTWLWEMQWPHLAVSRRLWRWSLTMSKLG